MSTETHPNQLGDADAVFLAMEMPGAYGHVSGLAVLDPSDHPDWCLERLVRVIEERITLVPRFTWKLEEVPLGLDRPYWVPDEDFEVRKHLSRIALPAPGGMRELAELAGHLHAQPLDRSRALWEMWMIEGLEAGKVAFFMKSHHCLMDGQSGAGLSEVLCDLSPDAERPPVLPEGMDEAPPRAPGAAEVVANAVRSAVRRPGRRAHHVGRILREAVADRFRERDAHDPPASSEIPRLSFNTTVGARRGFATASVSLDAVKDVKKHFDVTVNDVVLELVGSALRRHLRRRGELPDAPVTALCPISVRAEGDQSLDNQLASMLVSLATDEEDPVERLQTVSRNTRRAKELVETSFDPVTAMGECLPPGLVSLVVRAGALAPEQVPVIANLVVSNVRGTPVPLYVAGARVEAMYPMSILQTGQGLNVTAVSYMDRIDFGLVFDPDLVPDAWEIAEQIPRALEELEAAAEGVLHRAS